MFTERLNSLFKQIDASNTAIAKIIGFDRTNISRFKSGKRVPWPDSMAANRLIDGIYLFADSKNLLPELCRIVGGDIGGSAEDIKLSVKEWLYEGFNDTAYSEEKVKTKKKYSKKKMAPVQFGEKFNASMNLAELSNVRLSQMVHADASLISRYRNGIRTPLSNPELSYQISSALYNRIKKIGRDKELSELMGTSHENLDEEFYYSWLYDKHIEEDSVIVAESLLGVFDSFRSIVPEERQDNVAEKSGDHYSNQKAYVGVKGLQSAVVSFLKTAIDTNAREMLLYSDEDMRWMYKDKAFFEKWQSLMALCVKLGVHIKIIHNVDRNLEEMNVAIKGWLPIYLSGKIESFYNPKKRDKRFEHSFFLIPDVACIRSFKAAGSDSEAIYYYHKDRTILGLFKKEFEALLANSLPLMHPIPVLDLPEVSDLFVVQSVLSLSTMPRELVRDFGSEELIDLHEKYSNLFYEKLKTNKITECIPLSEIEDLRTGKVAVNQIKTRDGIYYTKRQYAMHIEHIIRLLSEYENYSFCPVKESPYTNTDLLISKDTCKISTATNTGVAFAISHSSMCNAFYDYAIKLQGKYKIDKHTLIENLRKTYLE